MRARGSKWRHGRGGKVHLEGANVIERLVRRSVVSETDALGKRRPVLIFRRREQFHGAVPVTPPTLDFSVALGVVATGGGAGRASRGEHGREEFREELRGGVARNAWITSGASRRNQISSSKRGTNVGAERLVRGVTNTVLVNSACLSIPVLYCTCTLSNVPYRYLSLHYQYLNVP
jgi:hypothetical protein